MIATLVRGPLNVILMGISFMAKDAEHFFSYLVATYLFFGELSVQFICQFIQWFVDSLQGLFLNSL
jgi:hypothetical protein